MRTYSRQRNGGHLIENVMDLCRLCLEACEDSVPIFSEDARDFCASMAIRVMICVGLQITRGECLPNRICKECCQELEKYYKFRKKCELAYQRLKSHLQAIKSRELSKAVTTLQQNNKLMNFDSDEKIETRISENTDKNEVKPEVASRPDLPKFLSTMLVELGKLSQHGDTLEVVQDGLMLEMTGSDGECLQLQLLEEDDEELLKPIMVELKPIEESKLIKPTKECIEAMPKESKDITNRNLQCGQCGRSFTTRGAASRHARVHSGERPYCCATCGRRFAQRATYTRHLRVHLEKRPFQCALCPKSFTQRLALATHERTHNNALALHSCTDCNKVFLHPSGLSRHKKQHMGWKYKCKMCQKQFNDSSSLTRHHKAAGHGTLKDEPIT